jgi:aspartate aminotransferase-like enzyme
MFISSSQKALEMSPGASYRFLSSLARDRGIAIQQAELDLAIMEMRSSVMWHRLELLRFALAWIIG